MSYAHGRFLRSLLAARNFSPPSNISSIERSVEVFNGRLAIGLRARLTAHSSICPFDLVLTPSGTPVLAVSITQVANASSYQGDRRMGAPGTTGRSLSVASATFVRAWSGPSAISHSPSRMLDTCQRGSLNVAGFGSR